MDLLLVSMLLYNIKQIVFSMKNINIPQHAVVNILLKE